MRQLWPNYDRIVKTGNRLEQNLWRLFSNLFHDFLPFAECQACGSECRTLVCSAEGASGGHYLFPMCCCLFLLRVLLPFLLRGHGRFRSR